MNPKAGSTSLQTLMLAYDDFEPLCTWKREEAQDTLVLHLPDFKKEQLRIQISNTGILKITGERPVNGTRRSRFQKEVKVTKDYNSSNIQAKFSQGLLRVILPKKMSTSLPAEPPSIVPVPPQQSHDGSGGSSINTTGETVFPNITTRIGQVLKSDGFKQAAVNIGFVVVVAFSAYVIYKYWTMYVKVDED